MTAVILAGGKSTRMSTDKAFIKIEGLPLVNRQLKLLKKVFKKVIIVTNHPEKYKGCKAVKVIKDIIPERGPLGGIYSGLMESESFYNFVIACDTPFLNLDLIRYMISLKDGFDVIVPKLKKGYETLFAIYSRNCISPIYEILYPGLSATNKSCKVRKSGLNSNNLRVTNFFNKVKLRKVSEEEVSRFGDPNILFMNINTREDLAMVKKIEAGL